MTRRPSLGWALYLSSVGALACEDAVKPPATAWSGVYLDYGQSEGLQPCVGTHAYADGFVPFLAGELGMDPTRASYSWLNSGEYDATDCPEASSGCAVRTHAISSYPFHLHEQVHAWAAVYDMNGLPFYTEGLAVAYDWFSEGADKRFLFVPRVDPSQDLREQMLLPALDLDYPQAGVFVTFLLARHGAGKFIEVSRRARAGQDIATIEQDFVEVYGVPLVDEVERFRSAGELPCDDSMFVVRPYDCDMPEIPWAGDTWVHTGILSCDDDDVAGGLGPDQAWRSVRSVTLTVPQSGRYRVRRYGDGDDDVEVLIGDCFACPWQHEDRRLTEGDATLELSAGTYFVRVVGSSDAAPLVGVVITPKE